MIKTHCKIEMKGGYHKETTVFNIVIVRGINVYKSVFNCKSDLCTGMYS